MYAAAASVVEVDVLTGELEVSLLLLPAAAWKLLLNASLRVRAQILSSDIVFDAGSSLNPLLDVGQVEGAFVIGLGHYLSESVDYSPEGVLESAGTFEYKVCS